jgi:SET domain-containing protein
MKHSNRVVFPHDNVYTRLGPSPIHGVGVFAIRNIPRGTYVFPDDDEELVWIDKRELGELSSEQRQLYEDFCVIKGHRYGCPINFNKLTVAWYLNESPTPNIAADDTYRFFSTRDIEKGEELTVDYEQYSDRPAQSFFPTPISSLPGSNK